MEKLYTIYKISSPESKRFYIGITSRELSQRFAAHKCCSRKNQKAVVHKWLSKHIKTAMIEPLMTGLTRYQACDIEQRSVELGRRLCPNEILNTADGGNIPPSNKGKKASEETRARMSAGISAAWSNPDSRSRLYAGLFGRGGHTAATRAKISSRRKGTRMSEEAKAKISVSSKGRPSAMKGKKHTEETRAKMRAAHVGRVLSEKHINSLRAAADRRRGKKHSSESKAKMSAFHKGKTISTETREKISRANKGKQKSERTRANMRAAWANRKSIKLEREKFLALLVTFATNKS